MWKQILLLISLLSWITPAPARAPVVLVLGDSLSSGYGINVSAGWVSLLQQRLKQQGYPHQLINASISGDTTSSGRARLPRTLDLHHPDLVIIELGANDGLRGLSLASMRANLAAMIKQVRARDVQVLLIGMHLPSNYGPAYTEKFHAVYQELARELKIPFVPFLLEGVALNLDLMQADGLHPQAGAQERVLENVWPVLTPLLRGRNAAPSAGAGGVVAR
jgi:acyl-CoA thioesterase-1